MRWAMMVEGQRVNECGTGARTVEIDDVSNLAMARRLGENRRKLNDRLRAQINNQLFFPGWRGSQYDPILDVAPRGLTGIDRTQQAQESAQQNLASAI
jgi:hypothetical protein